jgi:hypothetical protein
VTFKTFFSGTDFETALKLVRIQNDFGYLQYIYATALYKQPLTHPTNIP